MTINSVKIILLIFVSSIFHSCNGQVKSEHKKTETETIEIGKVVSEFDNQIWRIFQDSKGKYWFGSNGKGVYYLDGNELTLFTTTDGIVNNTVRGIQEDTKGNIYIETPEGISKFDGKQFTTLKANKSSYNQWKLNPIDLWFGYNANDIYRYDGDSLFQLKLPRKDLKKAFGVDSLNIYSSGDNPYAVYSVNKDKEGNIWFGTFLAGAFRYDGKSFLWFDEKELSILPDGMGPGVPSAPGVRSIIQDKDGYFWLSNFISKYKIEADTSAYKKLKGIEKDKPKYFNSGLSDNQGNLWITTYKGGVWKYDGETVSKFEINSEIEEVLLITIYQDKNGNLWLGTDNDGVYKQNVDKFEKFKLKK
ncbi:MAG: two-component regulator propeller domain-containing protein [Saprospiraceae bacterium]